jgi:hypothetical protein
MDPYMAMLLAQGVSPALADRFAKRRSPAPDPLEPPKLDWSIPFLREDKDTPWLAPVDPEQKAEEGRALAARYGANVDAVPGLPATPAPAGGLAAAASTPGPNAPIPPGQHPTGWIDPNGSDWQSKIAAIDRAVKARVLGQHGAQASGSTVASRFSTNADRAPEFADMTQTAPERLTPTLQRDNPATGRHWTLLAHEGIDPDTGQKTHYGAGFAQDMGADTPEQRHSTRQTLAQWAYGAPVVDPAQDSALMRLSGVGGGGGKILGEALPGSMVEHERAQEEQMKDLAIRHAAAQAAREEAQAKDPYGMGRFALEQAALNQRAQGRDQAGISPGPP